MNIKADGKETERMAEVGLEETEAETELCGHDVLLLPRLETMRQ